MLGRPELFWSVSAGCVDSMVANYTSFNRRRKDDDFTPGGVNDRRPDRACIAYTNLIKRHAKGKPVILGGIEASLRRVAHYDVWTDSIRRSVLFDSKADAIVYGMGELSNLEGREHSLAVARAAEKIAIAVNKNSGTEKLNPEHAYIYGLLHDIERQEGYSYIAHVYDGYHFLMSLGYENAARICLTHSFNLQTTEDYIGKIDITPEKMEEIKTLLAAVKYDDSTCGADGIQNLEQRMGDVKARYGYYPQAKWDKNFELKEYFENLAGRDLYDIIRE